VKTIADMYRHAVIITSTGHELFSFINYDDLEPPKRVVGEFFAVFGCSVHFKNKLWRSGWR